MSCHDTYSASTRPSPTAVARHADPSQCSTWIATAPRLAISLMNALFTWRQPVMLCEKTAVDQPPAGAGSAGAPTAPRTRS